MKKYDLHLHSYYSPCSYNPPKEILRRAKLAGLNGIAITDHHTMKAYPILKKLNKDKNFEIIPGEEITTQYGDVLALYIKKEIKTKDFFEVIKETKRQGGIIIIPHPITYTRSMSMRYPINKLKGKIDAIEIHNSRNTKKLNNAAKVAAKKYGFATVGSSDGHLPTDVGNGYTIFEGNLRDAIKRKKTIVGGTTSQAFWSLGISVLYEFFVYPIRKHWLK